jgi:hypothetical protein
MRPEIIRTKIKIRVGGLSYLCVCVCACVSYIIFILFSDFNETLYEYCESQPRTHKLRRIGDSNMADARNL